MALILNIDTATENAIIALANEEQVLAFEQNPTPLNHAAFVQPAIEKIFSNTQLSLSQIDAVAVSAGPGSYTGLRVGLASAKGLCFALNKPLILLNTLQIMAMQAKLKIKDSNVLYCPMIDARRMEVFASLFDYSLNEIIPTAALILTEDVFTTAISQQNSPVVYFGSGMNKWEKIASKNNAIFVHEIPANPEAINHLSQKEFEQKSFADVAYSEPLYAKNFYTTAKISGNN